MFVTTLAERLSLALRERGLSKADLSRLAFVSRATVTQWCSGEIQTMSSSNAERVAKALKVNRQWLETGRDTPAVPKDQDGELEARLMTAFSLLLEDQKLDVVLHIEDLAQRNREMLGELLSKYGDALPDDIVAKYLPPAPK